MAQRHLFSQSQFARPSRDQLSQIASIEETAIAGMIESINASAARILAVSAPLLSQSDIEGVLQLETGLGNVLQRPILATWENGWLAGNTHGILDMQLSVPSRLRPSPLVQFRLKDEIIAAIANLFELTPQTFRNLPAEATVRRRVLRLAGNFAKATLDGLKADLLAAITPQPDTGNPISRDDLVERIQKRVNVSSVRAKMIARTETTNSYNLGRVKSYASPLVTHLLFNSIHDHRRSEICESRDGMIIPVTDRKAIARNTPALHVNCRSVWSNLMPDVNPRHRRILEERGRLYSDRTLVALPKGWHPGQIDISDSLPGS